MSVLKWPFGFLATEAGTAQIILEIVSYLNAHCHVLMDIEIGYLWCDEVSVLVELIRNNTKTLKRIVLGFNFIIDADLIVEAALHCAHLTEFSMTDFYWTVETFSEIAKLIRENPKIKTLKLWGRQNFLVPSAKLDLIRMNDEVSVTFSDWTVDNAHGQGWLEILYAVPRVYNLKMSNCSSVSVALLQRVSASQPLLNSLAIDRTVMPCTLQELREICPQCDELSIDDDKWIRGYGDA